MLSLRPFWAPTEQLRCDGIGHESWGEVTDEWVRHGSPNAGTIPGDFWASFTKRLRVCTLDGAECAQPLGPEPPGGRWLVYPARGDERRDRMVLHEVTQLDLARLLHKLQLLGAHKEARGALAGAPAAGCLGFREFRALFLAQELTQDFAVFVRTEEEAAPLAALYQPLARAAWELVAQLGLPELFAEQYRPGDVIFYDLFSRERVGEVDLRGRLNSWLFKVQRYYDRFSHSGLFVRAAKQPRGGPYTIGDRPAVFHSIGSKVKILRFCASFACIPKREIDFSCVFGEDAGCWQGLQQQERDEAEQHFEQVIQRYLSQVATIRNKTAGTGDYMRIVRSSAAECKDMDKDPCSTWKLARDGEAGEARKVMCSGFTASLLLEAWRECAGRFLRLAGDARDRRQYQKHLRLNACGSVRPVLNRNALDFSPQDLHRWPVWRRSLARAPGLLNVAAPEVREAFAQLQRWLVGCDSGSPSPGPCGAVESGGARKSAPEFVSDRLVAASSSGSPSRPPPGRRGYSRASRSTCSPDGGSDLGPASPSAVSASSRSTRGSARGCAGYQAGPSAGRWADRSCRHTAAGGAACGALSSPSALGCSAPPVSSGDTPPGSSGSEADSPYGAQDSTSTAARLPHGARTLSSTTVPTQPQSCQAFRGAGAHWDPATPATPEGAAGPDSSPLLGERPPLGSPCPGAGGGPQRRLSQISTTGEPLGVSALGLAVSSASLSSPVHRGGAFSPPRCLSPAERQQLHSQSTTHTSASRRRFRAPPAGMGDSSDDDNRSSGVL
eukprot:TRINITY_DN17203_c0_g2_i1.p1 TRINITY_DN17203_c0_g2~~TRINITY_DN17203_c0_g2_i1.p1  ORF type:complete len:782 (+),score=119.03 TRINITY_DN17203_c0_g2_i1:139-2484(+)